MEKKTKNAAGNRNENPTPQVSKLPGETIIRYIIRSLFLLIVFSWALVNLDAVLCFLGKMLALFTPFLIGGAIAFLINVVLRPLECCWNKVCRKAPAKLTRPVCLTVSTVLVLGILFAVVFMMIPSLQKSGDEFIQNIPVYVEEIGLWWAGVVQFAAKYNIVLPEYAIDSDLLIEKVTALISNAGSGILTVTWGAATSVLSVLVDVLLGLVFALYLLAKKEVVAAHMEKLIVTVLPQKKAQWLLNIAALTNQTFTNFVSGQLTEAVIIGVLCFFGMLILGIPYAGDRRRLWYVFDSAGRTRQGPVVHSLSARFAAGGGQSDLSKGGRQVCRTSRAACVDGCYDRRRSIRHLRDAVWRSCLRRAVQPLSGIHEESKYLLSCGFLITGMMVSTTATAALLYQKDDSQDPDRWLKRSRNTQYLRQALVAIVSCFSLYRDSISLSICRQLTCTKPMPRCIIIPVFVNNTKAVQTLSDSYCQPHI